MVSLLVWILVLCLVFGIVVWIIQLLPLPPPFGMIAQAVVALILLLIVLDVLLGGRFLSMPRVP